jgi:hypothetical protein
VFGVGFAGKQYVQLVLNLMLLDCQLYYLLNEDSIIYKNNKIVFREYQGYF